MANTLLIEKVAENLFEHTLNDEQATTDNAPNLTTFKNVSTDEEWLDFKSKNGAPLISRQRILPQEITITDTYGGTGTFTGFTNVLGIWLKLSELGYFVGYGIDAGSGGVNRFRNLLDVYPPLTYSGQDGKVYVVNEAQNRLDATTFYNKRLFSELEDVVTGTLTTDMEGKILQISVVLGEPKITVVSLPELSPDLHQVLLEGNVSEDTGFKIGVDGNGFIEASPYQLIGENEFPATLTVGKNNSGGRYSTITPGVVQVSNNATTDNTFLRPDELAFNDGSNDIKLKADFTDLTTDIEVTFRPVSGEVALLSDIPGLSTLQEVIDNSSDLFIELPSVLFMSREFTAGPNTINSSFSVSDGSAGFTVSNSTTSEESSININPVNTSINSTDLIELASGDLITITASTEITVTAPQGVFSGTLQASNAVLLSDGSTNSAAKIESLGTDIELHTSDGVIFRGIVSGGNTFFQIGDTSANAIFSAKNGTYFNSLAFNSVSTKFNGSITVDDGSFGIINLNTGKIEENEDNLTISHPINVALVTSGGLGLGIDNTGLVTANSGLLVEDAPYRTLVGGSQVEISDIGSSEKTDYFWNRIRWTNTDGDTQTLTQANPQTNSTISNQMPDADGQLVASVSGSATLDFGNTSSGESNDLTIIVTGAVAGDIVALGTPNVPDNCCYTAFVSGANTVTVRFNNYSGSSIDPASGTFKVKILR